MKKAISIILSLVMILAVNAVAVSAFANTYQYEVVSPTETYDVYGKVNGKKSDEVQVKRPDENKREFVFTYKGKGTVVGWEIDNMVEGTDYEIVSETDDSITIRVSDDYRGDIVANCIVEYGGTTKKVSSSSKTSPKTGAAASGIIAMGAGVALLGALKKKED